jgi:hypothetical protein
MATAAMFIALGGGAYAAISKNSIKSKHIKDGAVSGADLADDSITGADVAERTLSLPASLPAAATAVDSDRLQGRQLAAWRATDVLDAAGPLPREATFTSAGGQLLISVAGSGFRDAASARRPGLIGMRVVVDGRARDTAQTYSNERDSHKSFSDSLVLDDVAAGTHSLRLEPARSSVFCNTDDEDESIPCTTTDFQDSFSAVVLELPR